jgi:succinyl-CoA synthetase beta subunit
LDRGTGQDVIIASTEGGVDIEEVAAHTPEKIFKEFVDPLIGLQGFQARRIAFQLGLSGNAFKDGVAFITKLYKAYVNSDASMIEINPALITTDDQVLAVDAKISLDDNALYRHPDLAAYRDVTEEDPLEVEAGENNLNYVKLDGNVGCMVNGAGLAMATMDVIKLSGGEPANFLDCRSRFPHYPKRSKCKSYLDQYLWWYRSLRPRSEWRSGSLQSDW